VLIFNFSESIIKFVLKNRGHMSLLGSAKKDLNKATKKVNSATKKAKTDVSKKASKVKKDAKKKASSW
jgi:hypothetical protein